MPEDPVAAMKSVRDKIMNMSHEDAGLSRSIEFPRVWGVLFEAGMGGFVVTICALADKTTSLYSTNGSGIIGGGSEGNVPEASRGLLDAANEKSNIFKEVASYPYPEEGKVKVYLHTYDGVVAADAEEKDLDDPDHELAGIFSAAAKVFAELRKIRK